ncbi:hypothetical protein FGB62_31g19 [Gracilaria domingensis]|nr:hypothetical protein FGB62_31g19 [Gracilaria domingensis]
MPREGFHAAACPSELARYLKRKHKMEESYPSDTLTRRALRYLQCHDDVRCAVFAETGSTLISENSSYRGRCMDVSKALLAGHERRDRRGLTQCVLRIQLMARGSQRRPDAQ